MSRLSSKDIPRREGNPFKVGDYVKCIHDGYSTLVEGEIYFVTGVDAKHVAWGPEGVGGAIFERFELANSRMYGADEYEEIVADQEAYARMEGK